MSLKDVYLLHKNKGGEKDEIAKTNEVKWNCPQKD